MGNALVCQGDEECRREREQHDGAGSCDVGGERSPEPSGRKRVARQTGEDRPCSTEANDEVCKPERGGSRYGMGLSEPCLTS